MICQYGFWFGAIRDLFHSMGLSTRKAYWDKDFSPLDEIPKPFCPLGINVPLE